MKRDFIELLNENNISISEQQLEMFDKYYELLIEWNHRINLTSLIQKDEVFIKHFYDSIGLKHALDLDKQSILDVGSGAGFPGIPLKIMFPKIQLTILDAQKKRIGFLLELVHQLNIEVELVHGRIEEHIRFDYYDLVTARAVAPLNVLCEFCLPFVKIGGYFLPMKAKQVFNEIKFCENAFEILGGKYQDVVFYDYMGLTRSIIKIEKVHNNPEGYPRTMKKIKKKPL